ncbi:MAG: hypothetical protein V1494_06055 [Candidatus Diapherotrites archaeon]
MASFSGELLNGATADSTLKLPQVSAGKKTVADLIVLILAREWPLSLRDMHYRINRRHAVNVSFQGIHKAARKLLREGILCKEQSLYLLDAEWLERLDKFSGETRKAYGGEPANQLLERSKKF